MAPAYIGNLLLLGYPTFTPLPHNDHILTYLPNFPTHPLPCNNPLPHNNRSLTKLTYPRNHLSRPAYIIYINPTYLTTNTTEQSSAPTTYIHTFIHPTTLLLRLLLLSALHTCMHACMHTYIHTCILTYLHAYIQGHVVSSTTKPLRYPITRHNLPDRHNHTRSSFAQATTTIYPTYTHTNIHTYMHTYKVTSCLTCYLPYLLSSQPIHAPMPHYF
jgi:hypothetical protein